MRFFNDSRVEEMMEVERYVSIRKALCETCDRIFYFKACAGVEPRCPYCDPVVESDFALEIERIVQKALRNLPSSIKIVA